jgi:hypothetical protein
LVEVFFEVEIFIILDLEVKIFLDLGLGNVDLPPLGCGEDGSDVEFLYAKIRYFREGRSWWRFWSLRCTGHHGSRGLQRRRRSLGS